jgi:hypothetical protein
MRVVEILSVRRRGATATVDTLPNHLDVGSIVAQGEKRWRVVSILWARGDRGPGEPAELELRDVLGSAVMPVAERDLELVQP